MQHRYIHRPSGTTAQLRITNVIWVVHLLVFQSHSARAQQPAVSASAEQRGSTQQTADDIQRRCELAKGNWCSNFHHQPPEEHRPAKQGNKTCLDNCLGRGVCNRETGDCACTAGFTAPNCRVPAPRECTNMGSNKRDRGWEFPLWTWTRCAGVCEDDIASCWCPPETKYGRIGPKLEEGSSPWGPAQREGRIMQGCNPKNDQHGKPVSWGAVDYKDLFGPEGWCNAESSEFKCPCRMDGLHGDYCNITSLHTCINQCSGRGHCYLGFCVCQQGWYGIDCSLRQEGTAYTRVADNPALSPQVRDMVMDTPASMEPADRPPRQRPLIYIYELPVDYNVRLMQYRIERRHCVWRHWLPNNDTAYTQWTYSIEPLLLEMLLASPHRTADPEEADFFYVPTFSSCIFELHMWAPQPSYPNGVSGPRPMTSSNMVKKATEFIKAKYPYWNRSGGRDHIFLWSHDEGACYAPESTWPAIMLTHWGRMDFPHESNTGYGHDNYSLEVNDYVWQPRGWLSSTSRAHPCYDPKKDLVVPAFKAPFKYELSPMSAKMQVARDVLAYFKGDVGIHRNDEKRYSRGIRQKLYRLAKSRRWRMRFRVVIASLHHDAPGEYSDWLSRSIFCLVLPGDGWSPRMEDAILHGCIPVIIMDDVHLPFETILDYSAFSIRLDEGAASHLPHILRAIPPQTVAMMQANVRKVWTRFRWLSHKWIRAHMQRQASGVARSHPKGPELDEKLKRAGSEEDDALQTILQWLHSRMGERKTPQAPPQPPQPPRPPPLYRFKEHQDLPSLLNASLIFDRLPDMH